MLITPRRRNLRIYPDDRNKQHLLLTWFRSTSDFTVNALFPSLHFVCALPILYVAPSGSIIAACSSEMLSKLRRSLVTCFYELHTGHGQGVVGVR